MKRCYSCKKSQGEQNYCKDRHRTDGLSNLCRSCMSKRYYETRHHKVVNRTPEEKAENNRKNRKWYKEKGKDWYENNKKKCKMRATINMAFRQGVIERRDKCDNCGKSGRAIVHVESIRKSSGSNKNVYKWKEFCRECRREVVFGLSDN